MVSRTWPSTCNGNWLLDDQHLDVAVAPGEIDADIAAVAFEQQIHRGVAGPETVDGDARQPLRQHGPPELELTARRIDPQPQARLAGYGVSVIGARRRARGRRSRVVTYRSSTSASVGTSASRTSGTGCSPLCQWPSRIDASARAALAFLPSRSPETLRLGVLPLPAGCRSRASAMKEMRPDGATRTQKPGRSRSRTNTSPWSNPRFSLILPVR